MDTRLEVAMIPVSDVDKAKEFYQGLGWRLDADFDFGGGVRAVQLTPPGSACSVSFGTGITPGLELVVDDIDVARADLVRHGAEVSETFHREAGKLAPGPDPDHKSYASYASFKDPDGNAWLLQEVTTRLPGRDYVAAGGLRLGSQPGRRAAPCGGGTRPAGGQCRPGRSILGELLCALHGGRVGVRRERMIGGGHLATSAPSPSGNRWRPQTVNRSREWQWPR